MDLEPSNFQNYPPSVQVRSPMRMLRSGPLQQKLRSLPAPGQIIRQWQLLLYTGGFPIPAFHKHIVPLPMFHKYLTTPPSASNFLSAVHCCHRLDTLVPPKAISSPPPSPAHWHLIAQNCFFQANWIIKIQVCFSKWLIARPYKVNFPSGSTKRMTPIPSEHLS